MTVYNFDTIDVDGKPEVLLMCLKKLVGERGFEPPTPWSRTRCSTRLSHSPTEVSFQILLHRTAFDHYRASRTHAQRGRDTAEPAGALFGRHFVDRPRVVSLARAQNRRGEVRMVRRVGEMLSLQAKTKTDRKSTRLNSSHSSISYAVFCLKKK